MSMQYRRFSKPRMRVITVKYPGPCGCCGTEIKAGEIADYYPIGTIAGRSAPTIAHLGGLDGNSPRCTSELRKAMNREPAYVRDPGEDSADRWSETHF